MAATTLTAESEMVPLKRATEMIGRNYYHAAAMIREGRFPLPTVRYGSRILVPRRAIEAYLRGEDAGPQRAA